MRLPRVGSLALVLLLAGLVVRAADEPTIERLIEQLDARDFATRKEAMKKLEARGEDALPALKKLVESSADVDVRLRAGVVIAAIDRRIWGPVRAMGAGA